MRISNCIVISCLGVIVLCLAGCRKNAELENLPGFTLLSADKTGLHFNNKLITTEELNIFQYMYFYNGGGVAVADFNKDNHLDIYFTGNQVPNKLYLNNGDLTFRDVSQISQTSGEGGWSTGVTITDINNDGWMDIYVNQVGDYRNLKSNNKLYVWKTLNEEGIPVFEESSAAYGLDLVGFGTQAGFFDYDNDGDLDLFELNHSVHRNGTFGERKEFEGTLHPTAGDRLFKNERGRYTDVTAVAGILSTAIGYGLGLAFSDINLDGWTDIYIANDFHENDYLYINQQNGTFKETINEMVRHTSRYSMGVDIADLNNDGHNEIYTLDMHPEDPYVLKTSLGEDDYGLFLFKLIYGYNYQYAHNALQLNNSDNTFSEIGIFADIYASDWSWAPLIFDFNHDGYKDIFVTNGIPKRMNDIDYVNFASNDDLRWKIQMDELEKTDLTVEEKIPEIKLLNKFYYNNHNLKFKDNSKTVLNGRTSFSNGAAYADFDNDGDLDIVVNNINDEAFLYQNNLTQDANDPQHYVSFKLAGPKENSMAIGAKAIVFKGDKIIYAEQFPVRGFQSFVSPVLHLGIGSVDGLDSILMIWPDHTFQKVPLDSIDRTVVLSHRSGLPKYSFHPVARQSPVYDDITNETGIQFFHEENEFVEFNREQLIPHMVSTEGPALAVGDINKDGLDDFFIGSSKRKKSALFSQTPAGKFVNITGLSIERDSVFEDVDASFEDIENDGDLDLIVATGGNEYSGNALPLTQRIYINDGKGNFTADTMAIPKIFMTAGCVATHDFNKDGFIDIFFGGRAIPWNYGKIPSSYLLLNTGNGKFIDVTSRVAPGLSHAGMIKDAIWEDMDNNGLADLILAVEWGPIQIFYQDKVSNFRQHSLPESSGWWNFIQPFDFDNDGDQDFMAGNLGLNSKLKPTVEHPVKLYINDFDRNGQVEQIMTYYFAGKEIIFPTFREVMRQLPSLKKKFLLASNFAKADMEELFDKDLILKSDKLYAERAENSYYENMDNKGTFQQHALPQKLQYSSMRACSVVDFNDDKKPDIMLAGNFYENNIELGRYDADFGSILLNTSDGIQNGKIKTLSFEGQIRKIASIRVNGKDCYLIAKNNGPLSLIRFKK